MRIATHAPIARRRKGSQFVNKLALLVEELMRPITLHPGFKNLEMFGIFANRCERHLMCAEGSFDGNPIHFLRTRPPFGCAQDDHRPNWLFLESIAARFVLNRPNLGVAIVQRCRQQLVHDFRIVTLDEIGLVPTPGVQCLQVCVAGSGLSGRTGNLVAVEVKNRQNRAVPHGIEKVDRLPASFERASLRFAVANNAGDYQIGIVERRAESVNQRVAKFAALVHRVRDVRTAMAGHAARRRELAEHKPQAVFIAGDLRMDLGIGAFEIRTGIKRRATMSGTGNVNDVGIMLFDEAIQMDVDEVLSWRCSPVPKQASA